MPYVKVGKGAPDEQAIINQAGRLVIDPQDLTQAFPYGGDYLGHALGGLEFVPVPLVSALSCPQESAYPYAYLWSGWEEVLAAAELDEWDAATVQQAFPGMTIPSLSPRGGRRVQLPGAMRGLLSTEAVPLLFVPDDEEQRWAIYIRSAVPSLQDVARLLFTYLERTTQPVIWRAEPFKHIQVPEEEELGVIDRFDAIVLNP